MKKIELKAKVLEIPKPKKVYTRFGTEAYITQALIGDETGSIRLNLWNKQINKVTEGDVINMQNVKVASFRGVLQIRIGKKGNLRVLSEIQKI